ncbi:hypothetical protein DFP72DRAFT_855544 [Ephemerocybe angulata]|uniref:Uncharacterized protein n=1 Tax=Ephemerocybe angulata TaxID=980116 RepID=A0A8H6LY25_9AGAR|nr:hypothetical protein DFP72DRAFT_855544 [Tulosesus angulatus]
MSAASAAPPFEPYVSCSNIMKIRAVLNDLRRNRPFGDEHRARILASDLAFLSHDASLQDIGMPNGVFSPAFHAFHNGTPDSEIRDILKLKMRRAMFDQAAMLDQTTGGTSFIVHIPGALPPGTPANVEHLRAFVYVPRSVIQETEAREGGNPVPELVQTVLRELGPPTANLFDRARRRYWPSASTRTDPRSKPLPCIVGMPIPIPEGSSRYLFYGIKDEPSVTPSAYFALHSDTQAHGEDEGHDTDVSTLGSDLD